MESAPDNVALLEAPARSRQEARELALEGDPPTSGGRRALDCTVTALIVAVPLAALGWAIVRFWGHGIGWFDLALTIALYEITGHGVTIGFHRLFTHRGFHASRWLRIALAVAGSLAVEGSAISWVALHRRHHVNSDRAGDPHSPVRAGASVLGQFRGLVHAHVGWLFASEQVDAERWCPDLLTDRDVVRVSSFGPLWLVASLALPFLIGLAVTQTLEGALLAMVWGGLVRIALVHHVTWSVNSLCHTFGRRPFPTNDRSHNLALLAIPSFGEAWHNNHHACPAAARHGSGPGEIDTSAALIKLFERLGWVTQVRWPKQERLDALRNETRLGAPTASRCAEEIRS